MSLTDTLYAKLAPASWQVARYGRKEQVRMMGLASAARERDAQFSGKFYAAAENGINRPMAPVLSTPEDYRQAYQRIIMIRYGRQMEDDVPYVESISDWNAPKALQYVGKVSTIDGGGGPGIGVKPVYGAALKLNMPIDDVIAFFKFIGS